MQNNADFVIADFFERLVQNDLTAFNGKAGFADGVADIATRNGTVQLSGFGCLTDDDDFQAVHLFGDLFGFLFTFQVGGFQLNLAGFKQSQIFFAGTQSFSLRQQIVAGITRFHFDDIAHLSQTFDTFE